MQLSPWLMCDVACRGETVLLVLRGELDIAGAEPLRILLDCLLEGPVVVDLGELAFLDASGLAPLAEVKLGGTDRAGRLSLRHPRPAAQRLFQLLGLCALLEEPARSPTSAAGGARMRRRPDAAADGRAAGVGTARRRVGNNAAEGAPARGEEKLLRSTQWNGLSEGDIVRVQGERGARFVFRCHVLNRANSATWIELDELALPRRDPLARQDHNREQEVRPVVRRQRSFAEERIVPPRRTRAKRAAPQGVQERFEVAVACIGAGPSRS